MVMKLSICEEKLCHLPPYNSFSLSCLTTVFIYGENDMVIWIHVTHSVQNLKIPYCWKKISLYYVTGEEIWETKPQTAKQLQKKNK